MGDVSAADLRCARCARRHLEATFFAKAVYYGGEEPVVEVMIPRRRRRQEIDAQLADPVRDFREWDADGRPTRWTAGHGDEGDEAVNSADRKAVKLPCRRCGAKPDVAFARLLPPLQAGYREIRIGPGGEVVPVGAPGRTVA